MVFVVKRKVKRRQRVVIPVWAVAEYCALSEYTVRKHAREGRFVKGDLRSVVEYLKKEGGNG